jgi:membrane protease subunit (stomatin/prohibitin family)
MAFIDLVEWKPQDAEVFAYRFPEDNLSTFTQLIVRESQEAIFFSKGQIIGKFGPGKHTLTTENLPLLRNLFGIPFGKKNPFTAEVWFVNKTAPLTIDWKTGTMRYHDPDYNEMVPVAAEGRYGLRVEDAERFLVKLVGTMTSYTSGELTDHFMGPLQAKTKSVIISYMQTNNIGVKLISASLDQLSTFIQQPMKEFWEDYGMTLTGFYITSVDLDTSTADGKKIAEAMANRSARNIEGYTWQQEQSFGVANNAFSKGGDMGVLGAVMMTGAMGNNSNMGNMMMAPGGMQQQAGGAPGGGAPQGLNARIEVFCSKCGKKYPTTSKFCPFCGDPYSPCPRCGSDNDANARRCVSCGAELAPAGGGQGGAFGAVFCSRCGQQVGAGLKFCPNCGNKIG